ITNDYIGPDELLGVGAGLVLVHGLGLIIGPVLVGWLMEALGPWSLFLTIMLVPAGLAVYAYWREQIGPAVLPSEKGEYVAVPGTTPSAGALDPRTDDPQLELPFEATDDDDEASAVIHSPDLPASEWSDQ